MRKEMPAEQLNAIILQFVWDGYEVELADHGCLRIGFGLPAQLPMVDGSLLGGGWRRRMQGSWRVYESLEPGPRESDRARPP